jgi:hypothetical protein
VRVLDQRGADVPLGWAHEKLSCLALNRLQSGSEIVFDSVERGVRSVEWSAVIHCLDRRAEGGELSVELVGSGEIRVDFR